MLAVFTLRTIRFVFKFRFLELTVRHFAGEVRSVRSDSVVDIWCIYIGCYSYSVNISVTAEGFLIQPLRVGVKRESGKLAISSVLMSYLGAVLNSQDA